MIAAGIVAVVLVAIGQLGTSKSSARTETEIVTASTGVVQSTVSGTGSLEPVTEDDVDFQTSGTLSHLYVKNGEYVHKGQLLGTLDDTDAALTLKQAKVTLAEARTTLSSDKKSLDDSSSSSDTSNVIEESSDAEDVSYKPTSSTPTQTATTTETVTVPSSASTPTTTATTTPTEPTRTTQTQTATETATEPTQTTSTATQGSTTGSTSSRSTGSASTGSSSTGSSSTGSTDSGSSSTVTAATVDADKLQVVEDEQTVREDRQSLDETRLRSPVRGTITSVESIEPGDSVSSGSSSSGADSSSSTSDSTTAEAAAGSTSTGSTSSSSTSFVEIDSLKHLSMTVSFTEADINKLKVGQAAVVTLDALSDLELAGKVTNVSSIGTTSDDVTSYDATVTLNQYDSRVKPGMSASAEVVIKQAHGVTVPSGAVTGTGNLATVTEDANGKKTSQKVIVGLRGDSRDLIVSGLSSGAELVETETLPATGSSASTASSASSSATGGFSRRSLSGATGGGFPGGGFSGAAGGGGPP